MNKETVIKVISEYFIDNPGLDQDLKNKICKNAIDNNPKTANDVYYSIIKTLLDNKINKKSYPVMPDSDIEYKEYDLDKWIKILYKIYDQVEKGYTFESVLNHYSKYFDKSTEEDKKFRLWVEYYKNNEHKKYSKKEGLEMNKKSDYQFGLVSPTYPKQKMPYDVFEGIRNKIDSDNSFEESEEKERALQKEKDKELRNKSFKSWKDKAYGAIRRLDKLLRSDEYLTPEEQEELSGLLHSLDVRTRHIFLKETASDLFYQTSTIFKSAGKHDISNYLIKTAQEINALPEDNLEEIPVANQTPSPVQPAVPAQTPQPSSNLPGTTEEVKDDNPANSAITRALTSGEEENDRHGQVFDEINSIQGTLELQHAAEKLEEVAARLADRRTIRQLAEFDIMLDKLGIAALFPELAEAQSKLIDAYSYALVRVTKMLGMLSSGKSMAEISSVKTNEISNKAIKEVNKSLEEPTQKVNEGPSNLGQEVEKNEAPVENSAGVTKPLENKV